MGGCGCGMLWVLNQLKTVKKKKKHLVQTTFFIFMPKKFNWNELSMS